MIAKAYILNRFRRIIEVLFITLSVFLNAHALRASSGINLVPAPITEKIETTDTLEALVNRDVLVLQRYGSDKRKWVKKGTLLKVYVLPFSRDSSGPSFEDPFISSKSFMSSKEVYRGHFESMAGDTLTLIASGKEMKFDIDNLYKIKVFNEIGARVFGDMLNVASGVGFLYAGVFLGAGVALAADNDPWTQLALGFGGMFAGASFLVHRLALIIRRNKYDLMSNWYIIRSF